MSNVKNFSKLAKQVRLPGNQSDGGKNVTENELKHLKATLQEMGPIEQRRAMWDLQGSDTELHALLQNAKTNL